MIKQNLNRLITEKHAHTEAMELPTILAEEVQMVQLFQNLISTAVKYNTSAEPLVTISYVLRDSKHMIRVADNGVGIPEDKRKRIFEIFERIENQSNADGTGIGLSTCKSIVERMNGSISVESNQPEGSVFVIELPYFLKAIS